MLRKYCIKVIFGGISFFMIYFCTFFKALCGTKRQRKWELLWQKYVDKSFILYSPFPNSHKKFCVRSHFNFLKNRVSFTTFYIYIFFSMSHVNFIFQVRVCDMMTGWLFVLIACLPLLAIG